MLQDVKEKVYPDGSVGNYYCTCSFCGSTFIGHKRDYYCGCPLEDTEQSIPTENAYLVNVETDKFRLKVRVTKGKDVETDVIWKEDE